ncbi:MAG: hypothetical protein ACSHYF_06455 [Verrucomicrobiaceae bacterium]
MSEVISYWKKQGGLGLVALVLASCAGVPASRYPAAPSMTADASREGAGQMRARSAPVNRPGLATGFGERMDSSMGYTDFVRGSSKPISVSMIRYNDEEGAKAMDVNRSSSLSGLRKVSEGYVEWGVKSNWRTLKNYWWRGDRLVIGRKGSNYSLLVKNLTRSRLEVVLSVDGLDVIDGKTASTRKRGYIVHPGKTLEVKGFRTSHDAVAAFEFSSVRNSYANLKHGETRNVGVLGLAVYPEKGIDPWNGYGREGERRVRARAFAEEPIFRARNVTTD